MYLVFCAVFMISNIILSLLLSRKVTKGVKVDRAPILKYEKLRPIREHIGAVSRS